LLLLPVQIVKPVGGRCPFSPTAPVCDRGALSRLLQEEAKKLIPTAAIDTSQSAVHNQPMKVQVSPKTLLGKWAVWLIVAFVFLFAVFQLLVASGQRGGETFFDNLLLAVPIVVAAICGISSLVTGLVGIIKSKEQSILVFVASFIGILVLIFVLGEFVYPH